MTGERGSVPGLRKGLSVLMLLAGRAEPMAAATIARELELARSTVYDLLTELEAAGFVVRVQASRRWGLGVAAFEIGSAYRRADPLERAARPVLTSLAEKTGGTAHLGVLHGNELLYLAKSTPTRVAPTLITDVGVRLPGQLTATGLAVLARLPRPQVRALFPGAVSFVSRTGRGPADPATLRTALGVIRRQGWAEEDGQVAPDTASVAAAVFDHASRAIAAIGITVRHLCAGEPDSGCREDWAGLIGPVRAAASRVTASIGGTAPVGD